MTLPIVTISKVILHTQTKLLFSVAPAYYQTMLFFIDTKPQCQNVNFAYAQVFNTRIAMQWTLVFSCEAQSQKNPKENGSVYGLCMYGKTRTTWWKTQRCTWLPKRPSMSSQWRISKRSCNHFSCIALTSCYTSVVHAVASARNEHCCSPFSTLPRNCQKTGSGVWHWPFHMLFAWGHWSPHNCFTIWTETKTQQRNGRGTYMSRLLCVCVFVFVCVRNVCVNAWSMLKLLQTHGRKRNPDLSLRVLYTITILVLIGRKSMKVIFPPGSFMILTSFQTRWSLQGSRTGSRRSESWERSPFSSCPSRFKIGLLF